MARTVSTVQRAVTSWCQIFLIPQINFEPEQLSCLSVSREVKKFLGSCPSSVESERMAFQSIKKLLPPSCPCMEEDLLISLERTLTSPARALPKGYLSFVRHRVERLFRKGWDVGSYSNFCFLNSPGLAATTDSSRLEGGCLGAVTDQVELLDRSLGNVPYDRPFCHGSLMVVQSAGKPRPLTKFRSEDLVLRPLHKSLYDHLSRTTRWLCRGDPTKEKLERAGFRKGGGVLVSGDYQSATDNLSLEVAELILSVILENSVSVPVSVKAHAMAILRPLLWNLDYGIEFECTRGQMMGSYLSFPLLCVQNFLSFEFAREREGLGKMPLLINGDDILFQSPCLEFPGRWMVVVETLGLQVEVSKTSVSEDFGTLNSTLFEWKGGLLEVTPTLRFGMLRKVDYVNSLGTTFHSFVRGQEPGILWRASRTFFSWHLATMKGVRFYPDELGFRGALAFRMSRIFGLIGNDLSLLQLPRAPIPHNVVYASDDVILVRPELLSRELEQVNNFQMASWKFSVDFQECRSRASLRYCLSLSEARRPVVSFSEDRRKYFLSDNFSWRSVRRKRFFRPVFEVSRGVPVFLSVLQSQLTLDYELPPSYDESVGVGVMVSAGDVPTEKPKVKEESSCVITTGRRPCVVLT
jgi:hypothetical protein